jgi:hypothetical protein
MDAWLEEMRAWRKDRTACQEAMEVCLEKAKANTERMKAGLEEMKAAVDVFEERLVKMVKMDITDLEANPEEKESVAEQQDVFNEEAAIDIGALKERSGDRRTGRKASRTTDPLCRF